MQSITEGIYYQNAYAGVTLGAIILPHGTLLIDSPLKSDDARSWKSIQLTQSRGMHRLLVNLDEHTDRTIGNRYMDLTIIAHRIVANVFENHSTVFKGQNLESGAEWEHYPEIIGSRWIQPNIIFNQQMQLHWGDLEIRLNHRPGPTSGSIWVEIPSEKITFIGDCVVNDQPPFLALANIPVWLEALNLLLSGEYDEYTLISGRSGPITLADARNQFELLKTLHTELEGLSRGKITSKEIENLIPNLLSMSSYDRILEGFYTQRLKHGLNQYIRNHYSSTGISEEA